MYAQSLAAEIHAERIAEIANIAFWVAGLKLRFAGFTFRVATGDNLFDPDFAGRETHECRIESHFISVESECRIHNFLASAYAALP